MSEAPKIKVCHISSLHGRYDTRIFAKECVSLSYYYDVFYFVNDDKEDEKKNNVNICSVSFMKRNFFYRLFFGNRKLIDAAIKTDSKIFHLHDPELLLFWRKLKKNNCKVVFDSHEFYKLQILTKEYIPYIFRKTVSLLYAWVESYVLRRIDALIVPCTINGKIPINSGKTQKIIVGNMPIAQEHSMKIRTFNNNSCIYVGSITASRGIKNNIIASYNAGFNMTLVGKYHDNKYWADLIALKEFSCVHYLGNKKISEIPEILSSASIGLSTLLNTGQYNIADNLPTKVYEYMAMGMPVIISESEYVKSLFIDKPFGLMVDPTNYNSITKALLILKTEKDLYHTFSANCIDWINTKFNWSLESKKLTDLYESLLG